MIENLDSKYRDFFDEPDHLKRWSVLKDLYSKDYQSSRVLFHVEVMALLNKSQEPTTEELNGLLTYSLSGGRIAIQIGRVIDLLMPIWPLEMAKFDVLIYKTVVQEKMQRSYFLTSLKAAVTALVQSWWAFETLMNDFAGIIRKQRKSATGERQELLLEEKTIALNKKGEVEERLSYQPIGSRIQFLYSFLTGRTLDRASVDWRNLMNLKNARDAYIHRLGKERNNKSNVFDEKVILDGFRSVRRVIADVFRHTPEFWERFVYRFLAFWSCDTEEPFIWDSRCGDGFYLGQTSVDSHRIVGLFAPMPGSFATAEKVDIEQTLRNSQRTSTGDK